MFQRILRNSKRIQARKLFSYNIVLIGFMGAGKSTISDYLSTMFDMRLVEMDQEISEREEMSIPDIFATYGEEYFRNLETKLLKETAVGEKLYYILRRRRGAPRGERCRDEEEREGCPPYSEPGDHI